MQLQLATVPCLAQGDGVAVMLGERDAALLAWLAIEGPTSRERLAALLWPGSSANAARNSLRQRLFQLRRAVGADVIVGTSTLALASGVEHDLAQADCVLAGFIDDLGDEFHAWLTQQRERRRARMRAALQNLADLAEQGRDFGDALIHAQELLALDPLSEAAHRRQMRLHYLAGDRAAALLAFDRCERVLKDDVGARPSAETLALLHTIESAAAPLSAGTPRSVPAALLRPPRLIGRDAELALLVAAVAQRGIAVVYGEAGMGKSRLLEALAEHQAADRRVILTVGARPSDAGVPYAVAGKLTRALRTLVGEEAATAPPALGQGAPELGAARAADGQIARARALAAVDSLLRAAVEHGLQSIVVDDLQFADPASIELLGAVVESGRCAWVLATRRAGLDAVSRSMLDGLEALATLTHVELRPLDASNVHALLDSLALDRIDSAAYTDGLLRRSGGNPLFMLETLKALWLDRGEPASQAGATGGANAAKRWPETPNVTRVIQQRLSKLSPLARRVTQCAAVAAEDNCVAVVASVLGLKPLDLSEAWAELEGAQVLRGNRFTHDLVAQAGLDTVSPAIAHALHADVAAWLEQAGGEPASIARHWLAAQAPKRAAPHLLRCAERARDAWRLAEAAELYERAADILRNDGQGDRAFDAYVAAADARSLVAVDEAFTALHDAMQPLARREDQRAMLALTQVVALAESRQFDEASRVATEALPMARRCELPEIESALLWGLAAIGWERREVAEATRLAERALALLAPIDPSERRLLSHRTDIKLLRALGLFHSAAGRFVEGNARLLRARGRAEELGNQAQMHSIAQILANNALDMGDLPHAVRWCREAVGPSDHGSDVASSHALGLAQAAAIALASGELGEAMDLFERVSSLCAREASLRTHVAAMLRREAFWFHLGRRDLAVKGLAALRKRADLSAIERDSLEAAWISVGERGDVGALFDRARRVEDFPLRVRLLCQLARRADPAELLARLQADQATALATGAHGLWLGLQVARVEALRRAGNATQAADAASSAWEHIEAGVRWWIPLPEVAAELCTALASERSALASTIASRAAASMGAAAATLPCEWRHTYLGRSPAAMALNTLPASIQASLFIGPAAAAAGAAEGAS